MSRRSCTAIRARWPRCAAAAAMTLLFASGAAAQNALEKPDCAALEAWAAAIDGEDRWLPLEGYRGWLPRSFQDPAFAELFGAAALDWRVEDAKEMAAHVFACGKQAAAERRIEARNALYAARGYFISNLRGLLGRQETMAARAKREAEREAKEAGRRKERAAQERARAEARQAERDAVIEQALAAVLDQPASPQLLRTLAVLAALVLLLEPALELRNVTKIKNHVVLLVDSSLSMTLPHEPEQTRWEAAQAFVEQSQGLLTEPNTDHHFEVLRFDDVLHPSGASEIATAEATGRSTLILEALETAQPPRDREVEAAKARARAAARYA